MPRPLSSASCFISSITTGDAGVEEVHRDAAAHRAGADDGDLVDLAHRRRFRHVGDLGRGALGEERVAQRLALGREHQRGEGLALVLHAVLELGLGGLLDAVDAARRRREVLGHRLDRVAREAEVRVAVDVLALDVAHHRQRTRGGDLVGERERAFHQVALDHAVEQLLAGDLRQQLALDRLAADDHVQRGLDADRARQALRAAGARQDAQLDFGQRDRAPGDTTR